jgi:hypothetical protein
MTTFNEVYLTYEMRRRQDEFERMDRSMAAYDHPFEERNDRVSRLIDMFRRAWAPATVTVPAERETREVPMIYLD